MFRNYRLGEIPQEVLDYISSRQADSRIFEADLLVDRAHLIMLKEQGLITTDVCSKIISILNCVKESDLGSGEDVHEAIESFIVSKIGPDGGRMHTGRSRNDEVATCIRLALRQELIELMDEQLSLIRTVIDVAENHIHTLIPGFTHTQHAQPTTLAHHLLAHADSFLRDLDRIGNAYTRVNMSPLGSAAFASTGFPIDRQRTCDLLGFDGLVENSMDAVSSRDFILEVLAALSILMVNLSRLAEELILWSTSEFGYLEIDNLFASTSSIMPQKKNPDTAELARAKTGSVIGSLLSTLTLAKALPLSYNRDLQEATLHLWRALDWTRSTVRIMAGCLSTLHYNKDRLEESSEAGFSTATELADSLVRITGMPFRTAHSIVGHLAAIGQRPTLESLDKASMNFAGYRASDLGFSDSNLEDALDPHCNVMRRNRIGGPAPSETERMIKERRQRISAYSLRLRERREDIEHIIENLKSMK